MTNDSQEGGLTRGRPTGTVEWCPELEALRDEPYVMLLAAVVIRARCDSPRSRDARAFLERVRLNARAGAATEAVLAAMDHAHSSLGRHPRQPASPSRRPAV